jgi:hypothetical protein
MNLHTLIGFTLSQYIKWLEKKRRCTVFQVGRQRTAIGRSASAGARPGTSRAMPGIWYGWASLRKSSFDDVLAALHRGDMTANEMLTAHRND